MSEPGQVEVAVPVPLKLRGSCESCSVSKVRCDKTKPMCSRCARRKITCQYVATKRVGRKQDSARKRSSSSSITSPAGRSSKHNSVDMSRSIAAAAITQSPSQLLPQADMGGMALMSADMDVDLFMSSADHFDYSVFSSLTDTNTNTNTSSSVQTPSPQPSSSTATTASLPVWDLFSDFFPMDPTLAAESESTSVPGGGSAPATYEDFEDLFTAADVDDKAKATVDSHYGPQGGGANPLFSEGGGFTAALEDPVFMTQLMSPHPQQHTLQGSTRASPGTTTTTATTTTDPQLDLSTRQHPSSPSCGPCIAEALALMCQLFPPNPPQPCTAAAAAQAGRTTTTTTTTSPHSSSPSSPPPPQQHHQQQQPTFEAITSQKEAVIDACIGMLRCACARDDYLLAVVALIVFKVLAWYAAAVHCSPSSSSSSSSSCCSVGAVVDEFDDTARVAAQLVLGKMHRVQHLVNQLAAKLRATQRLPLSEVGGGGGGPAATSSSSTSSSSGPGETAVAVADRLAGLPVSGAMLDQLEADLRKRLRALSLEVIGVLRRE